MTSATAPNLALDPDAEICAHLYEEHADAILRYCRRQLGSEAEAEDALQTTFVYALRAICKGVHPENEAAWLTTIAKNVCHWQRRTLARRGWHTGEVDFDAIESSRPEPGAYEDLRGLDEALASIPEQQRRAIVLREWLGVGPAEIAGKLGLSPTATHALLSRARVSLAGAMTVARQPALALVWLVYELRSLLRNLVAAASTKAGVAAVTIAATTGVGGLVAQHRDDTPAEPVRPVAVASAPVAAPAPVGSGGVTSGPRRTTRRAAPLAAPRARRVVERVAVASPSPVTPPRRRQATDAERVFAPVATATEPSAASGAEPTTSAASDAERAKSPGTPALPTPGLPSVDPLMRLLPGPPAPPSVVAPTDVPRVATDVASDAPSVVSGTTDLPSIPPPPPVLP